MIPFATGLGYDVHRFAPGRRLVLCGVEIPCDVGLLGHSDADVALHALCDAILGAAGLRDIGFYFPNSDERWRGADSRALLRECRRLVEAEGWSVGNLDVTIVAEKPKIMPHIEAMKAVLATDLGIEVGRCAVKATTNEGMGFVGREEGIAALATTLLWREQG